MSHLKIEQNGLMCSHTSQSNDNLLDNDQEAYAPHAPVSLSSFVPRHSITIAGSLINIRNIPRNYPRGNSILITPPIIAQLTLPRPKDPTIGILLIFRDLRRKPLTVKCLLRTRVPRTGPLNIIWYAKTEFADNSRCFVVAIAVVVACVCQVARLGDSD